MHLVSQLGQILHYERDILVQHLVELRVHVMEVAHFREVFEHSILLLDIMPCQLLHFEIIILLYELMHFGELIGPVLPIIQRYE